MCVVLQDELNRLFVQELCLSLTHQGYNIPCVQALFIPGWMEEHGGGGGGMTLFPVSTIVSTAWSDK